jgi:retron-type reverse transcriptase
LEDEEVDSVKVISFDFSKAFDSVPHDILCEKLKQTKLNPYIINWILDFLTKRKQRVVVDGIATDFLDINRGVPQGTVIGPFLFSLMVNDINLENPDRNLLTKFADDLTVSAPVTNTGDSAASEVRNIKGWASENRMDINMSKTWEMVVRGKSTKPLPLQLDGIERKK